jgi:hypothetical protein
VDTKGLGLPDWLPPCGHELHDKSQCCLVHYTFWQSLNGAIHAVVSASSTAVMVSQMSEFKYEVSGSGVLNIQPTQHYSQATTVPPPGSSMPLCVRQV